jgi:hypothetical protein
MRWLKLTKGCKCQIEEEINEILSYTWKLREQVPPNCWYIYLSKYTASYPHKTSKM